MRRLLLLVVLPLVLLLQACTPEQAETFIWVNETRAAHGLPMLDVSPGAVVKAQAWAEKMAAEQRIWHSGTFVEGEGFWSTGENVGRGTSIEVVQQAFMNSPSHKANILESFWTHQGTGVAWNGDTVYVVQVFAG